MAIRPEQERDMRAPPPPRAWEALYAWTFGSDPHTATFDGVPTAAHFAIGRQMRTNGWRGEHGFIVRKQAKPDARGSRDPTVTPRSYCALSAAEEFMKQYARKYPEALLYIEQV